MGAIGGLYSFAAGRPDLGALETLARLQSQIGPDDLQIATHGPVALLYCPFCTQPAAAGENRMYRSASGDVLIWNGRLDNRRELATSLGVTSENLTDVELVCRALELWSCAAFSRLLGDFSLAFWQPAVRRLTLATDIWALKPVFYYADSTQFVWASRCRSIADALRLPLEVEEEFVANFLIRSLPSGSSPLKRIKMLSPASFLVLEDGRPTIRKYWFPDASREIRHRRDEDYEQQYLDLLQQAIACRLEAPGPVFTELSGGLDSSSIACLGHQLIQQRKAASPELCTTSYVYRDSPSSDESRYISVVESHLGRQGLHIDNDDAPLLSPPACPSAFRPDLPAGQLIYLARNQFLADRMAEYGSRVLLRGFGGDQVTWGDVGLAPFAIGDHVITGRWARAVRSCWRWSLALKIPFHLTFWRGGLWPLLPRAIRKRTYSFALPVDRLFHADFIQRFDLRDRTLGPVDDTDFHLPSQSNQYTAIREVAHQVGWEFILEKGCVECRFPFLDRRLVEFALATPIERMVAPKEPRRMVRQALRGHLPPEIQTRRSKAGPDEAVYRTFARQAAQLARFVNDPLVAQYGFVDRDAFKATFERARYGGKVGATELLRTFALEFWLRSLGAGTNADEFAPQPSVDLTEQQKEIVS